MMNQVTTQEVKVNRSQIIADADVSGNLKRTEKLMKICSFLLPVTVDVMMALLAPSGSLQCIFGKYTSQAIQCTL